MQDYVNGYDNYKNKKGGDPSKIVCQVYGKIGYGVNKCYHFVIFLKARKVVLLLWLHKQVVMVAQTSGTGEGD